ncbi:hypothetical protein [Shimia aestuarii]|uniref:Uncharacterized protein n=1 Tax=Shimia aestuarii TaxID=254406 RepID=A0A1I4INE6_9RHOB|nr:hypothetical protein [Shimia aestuarii]SFL55587.1 hypothetical protein SAMN04488042_101668 [Shimia aestuarii]
MSQRTQIGAVTVEAAHGFGVWLVVQGSNTSLLTRTDPAMVRCGKVGAAHGFGVWVRFRGSITTSNVLIARRIQGERAVTDLTGKVEAAHGFGVFVRFRGGNTPSNMVVVVSM